MRPSPASEAQAPAAPGVAVPQRPGRDDIGPTTAAQAAVWQVQLLGRVQAVSAHGVVQRWPTRAVACLLARLATAPRRSHAREALIDVLWPEAPPEVGRPRLRQTLSQLRSLLEPPDAPWPPVLLADRQSIRLAPGAVACDALAFAEAAVNGDAATASALYLGEFMPGHYGDWVLIERRRLESLHERLPAAAARPSAAPAEARHAGLPQGHGARSTPPWAAPADSAAARSLPPVRPGPGSVALLGAVPSYWTHSFGTAQTLARLRGFVVNQRLVTLLGPGGSGKTRLACELAQALLEPADPARHEPVQAPPHAPFARVLYASLADCTQADALAGSLLQRLQPAPGADALSRLAGVLGAVPTLAVLDNVEQLDDAAAEWIVALLRAAPSLHLLLTSRRRLGLDGERVFELPGLALAAPAADIGAALASPAVALFVDRARASRPEFHLTAGNVAPVVGLTRLLGGMPLAIELAASRLRALQPAELLARLSAGAGSPLLDLLARPSARAGSGSRHASMRHVVAWSWQQLRPELATLLCALSVLPAPFSAEAAAQSLAALDAVALAEPPASRAAPTAAGCAATPSGATTDLARAQALLAEALETSLLLAQPAGDGTTLYSLLPPVREYAAEQSGAELPRRVRSALRRWLAGLAEHLAQADSHRLRHEAAHVTPLIAAAVQDEALDEALALGLAMRSRWNLQLPTRAVRLTLQQAVKAATDPAQASRGHHLLALLFTLEGRAREGLAEAERALALAPDPVRRAHAQAARAVAASYAGVDADTIDGWLGLALADAEASGDAQALLDVLRAQATIAVNLREDYATAEPIIRRSMQLHLQQGDMIRMRQRQLDLAACLGWTGREAEAVAVVESCIAAAWDAGETGTALGAMVQLGRLRLRQRQAALASQTLEAAVRMASHKQIQGFLLWALLHLPEAWVMGGAPSQPRCCRATPWPRGIGRWGRSTASRRASCAARAG